MAKQQKISSILDNQASDQIETTPNNDVDNLTKDLQNSNNDTITEPVAHDKILSKYMESDAEYEKKLAALRAQDSLVVSGARLKEVKIDGYQTKWASTDPSSHPSIDELKRLAWKIVEGVKPIPTGHHSHEGASFHVLMAQPNDIAEKINNTRKESNRLAYEGIFGKKNRSIESGSFLISDNKIENMPY